MALWPNPIVNKFPVSKSTLEKELGKTLSVHTSLNFISPAIETLALALLGKASIPTGLTYALVKETVKAKYYQLKSISDGLRTGRYRGVRLVVKYKAGPIYGYWVKDKTYYEPY
ncbi:hypothetical protein GOQ29_12795 [Clostridium sp. D2Q-14]|uniref:hypothetical protein n=1 Tax=Anaeromonas gelatinilytica TaxID=2683194 RepID=UPI00193BB8AD|nr:hypothetical protein [Anaeromonas gelatinilytica]MBS4536498.1 hypothetical protein [Anaeromonas gelatinilytica]